MKIPDKLKGITQKMDFIVQVGYDISYANMNIL